MSGSGPIHLDTDASSDAFDTGPMARAPESPKSAQLIGYTSSMMELPRVVVAFHGSRHLRAAMANYGRDVVDEILYSEDWWLASDSLLPSATQVSQKEVDSSDEDSDSSDEEVKVIADEDLIKALQVHFQLMCAFLDNKTGQKLATTSALETLLGRGNGHTELGKVPALLTSLPFFNALTESEIEFDEGQSVQFTTVDVEPAESLVEAFKTIVRDDGALITKAAPVIIGVYSNLGSLPEETIYMDQYTAKAAPETKAYTAARQKLEDARTKLGVLESQHTFIPSIEIVEKSLRRDGRDGAASELVELSKAMQQQSKDLAASQSGLESHVDKLESAIAENHPGGKYELVSLVCGTKGFVRRDDGKWYHLHPRVGEYDDPVLLESFDDVVERGEWNRSGIVVYEIAEPVDYNGELAPSVAQFCARDIASHEKRQSEEQPVESRALSMEPGLSEDDLIDL